MAKHFHLCDHRAGIPGLDKEEIGAAPGPEVIGQCNEEEEGQWDDLRLLPKDKPRGTGQIVAAWHLENRSCPNYVPSGAASISQFPLLGLISAKALFHPLSPAFTSRSPPPPQLWRPQNSALPTKDELTVGSQRLGAPSLARPRPTPPQSAPPHSTSLDPWVPARRRAQPQPQPPAQDPSQPCSPGRLPPRPRPALRPLGGYQLGPPARRRRLTANRRLPH